MKRYALLLVVATLPVAAQPLRFEVANVKKAETGAGGVRDGRLGHFVSMAWLRYFEPIKGGPDWVTLGADRFQLIFHREPKEQSGFSLVLGKNGPKLDATKNQQTALGLRLEPPKVSVSLFVIDSAQKPADE